jgi:virulence factor
MTNNSKFKIAIIGLGKIAQKAYLPILANHNKVDPILCTRNSETISKLSSQFRIRKTYSHLDEVIKSKPDAAMVHSSTESHTLIVSKLLKAKIPVFVDKPLSYSLAESEKILNLAITNKQILYLGFNRRFAPLVNLLSNESDPIQIFWQKNRVNLPDDPRVFIFDDFIHVIDSLRFLAEGSVKNINVFSKISDGKLENIQVQWQQNETLLSGGMNRISGLSEETIEYYNKGNKWLINDLDKGVHFTEECGTELKFDNWESTLYKRGFVNMIDDWIKVLEEGKFQSDTIKDIWETHHLCESILQQAINS